LCLSQRLRSVIENNWEPTQPKCPAFAITMFLQQQCMLLLYISCHYPGFPIGNSL